MSHTGQPCGHPASSGGIRQSSGLLGISCPRRTEAACGERQVWSLVLLFLAPSRAEARSAGVPCRSTGAAHQGPRSCGFPLRGRGRSHRADGAVRGGELTGARAPGPCRGEVRPEHSVRPSSQTGASCVGSHSRGGCTQTLGPGALAELRGALVSLRTRQLSVPGQSPRVRAGGVCGSAAALVWRLVPRMHLERTVGLRGAVLGAVCPGPLGLADPCLGPVRSLQGGRDTFVSADGSGNWASLETLVHVRSTMAQLNAGAGAGGGPALPSRTSAGVTRSHETSSVQTRGPASSHNPNTFQMHRAITAVPTPRARPHPGTVAVGPGPPLLRAAGGWRLLGLPGAQENTSPHPVPPLPACLRLCVSTRICDCSRSPRHARASRGQADTPRN